MVRQQIIMINNTLMMPTGRENIAIPLAFLSSPAPEGYKPFPESGLDVLPDTCGVTNKEPCFETLHRGLDPSYLAGEKQRICYSQAGQNIPTFMETLLGKSCKRSCPHFHFC